MSVYFCLQTYCNFNFNNWPWGEQNCTLEFGSWTYDMKNLDIVPYLQTFQESPILTFQENPIFSLAKNKVINFYFSKFYEI